MSQSNSTVSLKNVFKVSSLLSAIGLAYYTATTPLTYTIDEKLEQLGFDSEKLPQRVTHTNVSILNNEHFFKNIYAAILETNYYPDMSWILLPNNLLDSLGRMRASYGFAIYGAKNGKDECYIHLSEDKIEEGYRDFYINEDKKWQLFDGFSTEDLKLIVLTHEYRHCTNARKEDGYENPFTGNEQLDSDNYAAMATKVISGKDVRKRMAYRKVLNNLYNIYSPLEEHANISGFNNSALILYLDDPTITADITGSVHAIYEAMLQNIIESNEAKKPTNLAEMLILFKIADSIDWQEKLGLEGRITNLLSVYNQIALEAVQFLQNNVKKQNNLNNNQKTEPSLNYIPGN